MDNGQPAMEYLDDEGTRWRWQKGRHWIEANGTDTINLWSHEARKVTEPYEPATLTRKVYAWKADDEERLTEIWATYGGAALDVIEGWQTYEEAEAIADGWIEEAQADEVPVQIWILEHTPGCWALWNDPNNGEPEPCQCRQMMTDLRPARQWPEE